MIQDQSSLYLIMPKYLLIACAILIMHPAVAFQKKSKKVDADLTVVSFNIRYGTPGDGENKWKSRKAKVFNIFKKYKKGIIGVQEALPNQIDEILKEVPELGVIYRTRMADNTQGEATPFFYNKALWEPLEEETYWLSDTPEVPASTSWGNTLPRITTAVLFQSKSNGRKVRILNTHLDHRSQPSREKSVALMLARIAEKNDGILTLVMGDFNAKPDNEAIAKMKEEFKDSYTGGRFEGCTFHNWLGGSNCPRIDYIFYPESSSLEMVESGIDRYKKGRYFPSDHYPVYARFSFR